MIDLHYDLLSILYYSYVKNDFSYVETIQQRIKESGVTGVVANLYFMNENEMKEELGEYYKPIDVVEMFRIATSLFPKYFPDLDVVYSIEGCDYISGPDQLEELYHLGLRNILLVWNNPNRYGSGNRGDYGLTELGKEFLNRAIDLGISIDLSHMNHKTFYDTVEVLKEARRHGKDVVVMASHSNCYSLCNHPRNLDDNQILALKEFSPIIGLVSYGPFVSSNENMEELKKQYVMHIRHVKELLGVDCVAVSTDDMKFDPEFLGGEDDIQVFSYQRVRNEIEMLLKKNDFSDTEINQILYQNSYQKLFRRLLK